MIRKFTLVILIFLCKTTFSFSQRHYTAFGQESRNKVVNLYPNPASSQINFEIQHNNDRVYEIIIYNFLGKKFDELKISGKVTLSLDKYYSGIYIYQLLDMQGTVIESGKFNVIK